MAQFLQGTTAAPFIKKGMAKFTHPDAGSHVAKAWFVPTKRKGLLKSIV